MKINYDLFIHYFLDEWKVTKNITEIPFSSLYSINFILSLNIVFNDFSYIIDVPFNFNSSDFFNKRYDEYELNMIIRKEIVDKISEIKLENENYNEEIDLITNFNLLSLSDKNNEFIINSRNIKMTFDRETMKNLQLLDNIILIVRECFYQYNYQYGIFRFLENDNNDKHREANKMLLMETCNFGIV